MGTRTRRYLPAITLDPTGELHGLPTYHWTMAPPHLKTRRQLSAKGLRPGGQEPAGQLRRRGLIALLYDERLAKPKFTLTPAKLAAVWKAAMSRRRCGDCGAQTPTIPQQGPPTYGRCAACMGFEVPEPEYQPCPACEDQAVIDCPACNGSGGWEGGCAHCEGGGLIPCVLCHGR